MSEDISPEAVTEALQDLRAHEWTSTADLLEAFAVATTIGQITDAWRSRAQAAEAREAKLREALLFLKANFDCADVVDAALQETQP